MIDFIGYTTNDKDGNTIKGKMLKIDLNDPDIRINSDIPYHILNTFSESNGLIIDIERCAQYQSDFLKKEIPLTQKFYTYLGTDTINPTQLAEIKIRAAKRFNIPELKLISLAKDSVDMLIEDNELSKDAREFFTIYKEIIGLVKKRGSLEQFISKSALLDSLTFDGNRAGIVHPKWNLLATGRYSCSEPAFQNIDKSMLDIISYIPGMILCGADSGQIEPRITYSHFIPDNLIKHLILLYNDAYYGITHYTLLTQGEKNLYRHNLDKVKCFSITDDLKQKRQQIKKLMLSANYGGTKVANSMELGANFLRDIQQHPLRIKMCEKVHNDVMAGVETFYSALGTPITPKETIKYKKTSAAWKGHVERCGINNPIQATAADLMNISVYTANSIIRNKARSKLTCIAGYIHDAGYFYVSEKDSELVDDLLSCTAYQVYGKDGTPWIPIYNDKHIGSRAIDS